VIVFAGMVRARFISLQLHKDHEDLKGMVRKEKETYDYMEKVGHFNSKNYIISL